MASLVGNLDGGWHFCHIEKERGDQLLPCCGTLDLYLIPISIPSLYSVMGCFICLYTSAIRSRNVNPVMSIVASHCAKSVCRNSASFF